MFMAQKPSGPIGMILKQPLKHKVAESRIPEDVKKIINKIGDALSNNKHLPRFSEEKLMKIYHYSPDIATFCLLVYPEKKYKNLKAKIKRNPKKISLTLRYYLPMI